MCFVRFCLCLCHCQSSHSPHLFVTSLQFHKDSVHVQYTYSLITTAMFTVAEQLFHVPLGFPSPFVSSLSRHVETCLAVRTEMLLLICNFFSHCQIVNWAVYFTSCILYQITFGQSRFVGIEYSVLDLTKRTTIWLLNGHRNSMTYYKGLNIDTWYLHGSPGILIATVQTIGGSTCNKWH